MFGVHFPLLKQQARATAAEEDGGMSIFGLFMFSTMAAIGGIALDVSHLYSAQTQLQVAADIAAHSALYNRDSMSADDAKAAALAAVSIGMPEDEYGLVLEAEDIIFGTYDYETDTFTADPDSSEAVMVTTSRAAAESNAADSYLWRIIGIDSFDIVTDSIFTTFKPLCFNEGFVADGVVDIQSNNNYTDGFCVHSNQYVSINQNNFFEPGTVVSMPNISDLEMPASGFERNDGLEQALRSGSYRLRIINQLPEIIANMGTYGNEWMPDYITSTTIRTVSGATVNAASFTPGHIHILNCAGGSTTIANNSVLQNIVIATSCRIAFGRGVRLENVVIATTSTHARSFNGPNGVNIGKNDNCATGGGTQLLTLGSMTFASNLSVFGGQLLAAGNISFTANADGIQGVSFIAGGEISGTSNMDMGFCDNGMEGNIEANYFRLAR